MHKNPKNIDTNVMKLMLREIGRTYPMSRQEEQILFSEYKKTTSTRKKQEIKKRIVNANMKFVLKVALNYKNLMGVNIPDLVTEGKLGLLAAFDKFDSSTGNKFITCAVWWIKSKIGRYLEENDLIKIPTHLKTKLNKERKVTDPIKFDKKTYYLHELTSIHTSIDDTIKGSDLLISETIEDGKVEDLEKNHLHAKTKENLLEYLIKVLSKEEYVVISNLYGLETGNPLGLRDVKDIIGKSHERVRQLRDKALRTLRRAHGIKDFRRLFYI